METLTNRLRWLDKFRFVFKALLFARRRYTLVICSHVALARVGALLRLTYGTPYWVVCHGAEVWGPLPLSLKVVIRPADLLLPVSEFTRDELARANRLPPTKIRVLYNAIPDDLTSLLLASEPRWSSNQSSLKGNPILLSVGNLSKALAYKGFDTVMRSLPRLLRVFPNLRWVVVGDGDNRRDLETLASDLGISGHVTFTGELSDPERAGYYRACDVFVLPSRTTQTGGHHAGEGFGRVYVEAALAGKPVVGSRAGGAAEAVLEGKTGLLVDPFSEEDLVNALVKLLTNPELAARMSREGQRWALDNFTVSVMRKALAEMLTAYA